MRYFISLSYDGTNYSGWQTQPDAPTVQETIEKALTLVSRSPEPIGYRRCWTHGCWRPCPWYGCSR